MNQKVVNKILERMGVDQLTSGTLNFDININIDVDMSEIVKEDDYVKRIRVKKMNENDVYRNLEISLAYDENTGDLYSAVLMLDGKILCEVGGSTIPEVLHTY